MHDRDVDHAHMLHDCGLYTIRLSERQMCYAWLVTPGLFARVRACFKGARPTRSMFCTTGRRGRNEDFQARILFEKPRLILISVPELIT